MHPTTTGHTKCKPESTHGHTNHTNIPQPTFKRLTHFKRLINTSQTFQIPFENLTHIANTIQVYIENIANNEKTTTIADIANIAKVAKNTRSLRSIENNGEQIDSNHLQGGIT